MNAAFTRRSSRVRPRPRREFWRILYGINRTGTTIFASTPYLDEAERAHRVAFIDRGKILSCGTPQELKAHVAGEVIEILCEHPAQARRALRDEPLVRSVELFGEAVHALVASATETLPKLRERLRTAGIEARMRVIAPSLEDTFVARLTA